MSDNTKQLTEPFRGGLRRAVASYRAFEQTNAPLEPKEFAAHHNACKAALMHIALLLKLLGSDTEQTTDSAPDWVAMARADLAQQTDKDNEDVFFD